MSATSRAKLISCVASSIVTPSAFSSRTASSTSPTSSGSSALVTSSSSIARGRVGERPREGDALLLAARQLVGAVVLAAREPEAREHAARRVLGLLRSTPWAADAAEDDVVDHVEVGEEVVGLEDQPEAAPHIDRVHRRVGDHLAVEEDVTVVDVLEEVDAAQQRRLARPGGADHRDGLVLADGRGRCRAAPTSPPSGSETTS